MKVNNSVKENSNKYEKLKPAGLIIALILTVFASYHIGKSTTAHQGHKSPEMTAAEGKVASHLTSSEMAQLTALDAEVDTVATEMRNKLRVYLNAYKEADGAGKTDIRDSFNQARTDMQDARIDGCTLIDRKNADKAAYQAYVTQLDGYITSLQGMNQPGGLDLSRRVVGQFRASLKTLNNLFWSVYSGVTGSDRIDIVKYKYVGFMNGIMTNFASYSTTHEDLAVKNSVILATQGELIKELTGFKSVDIYADTSLTTEEEALRDSFDAFFTNTLEPALVAFNDQMEASYDSHYSGLDSSSQAAMQALKTNAENDLRDAYDNSVGFSSPDYQAALGVAYNNYIGLMIGYVESSESSSN